MKCYNEFGNKVSLKVPKQFAKGSSASVHLLDDGKTCLKKYFMFTPKINKIGEEEFSFLRDIDSERLINLRNYFYEIKKNRDSETAAFTYDYVPKDGSRVLSFGSDLFVENLYELENLFNYFSENHLVVYDLKVPNVVINQSGIVLIDLDRFKFKRSIDTESVKHLNKRKLLTLIRSIFYSEINGEMLYQLKIEKLFEEAMLNDKEMALEIEKKLSLHKKVGDYFK